jgi:hypothetical protein
VAFLPEGGLDERPDFRVVFDDQNAHAERIPQRIVGRGSVQVAFRSDP